MYSKLAKKCSNLAGEDLPDDDAVVDGETIGGKAGYVPRSDSDGVAQSTHQTELCRGWNADTVHFLDPHVNLVLKPSRGHANH